ncbi:MAG: endonuclease domain-containing protein [Hyphomonadaceae bacterium]|nr:endonuclease domain-containing protein [Hyphomonadaceae bacterium]
MRNGDTHKRARAQRRELTLSEAKLWSCLRDRRWKGLKFRRQHAIGPYVVDFACTDLRLVLEVDGRSHDAPEQIAFDAQRTAFLEKAGWHVARISNVDALAGGDPLYLKLDAIVLPLLPRAGEKVSRSDG